MKRIEQFLVWGLLVVFVGVVLHAPLSVWLGTAFPDYSLVIKAWKEVVLAIVAVVLAVELTRRKRWALYRTPFFLVVILFFVLHFLLLNVFSTGLQPTLAGLLIDLRYMGMFVVAYGVVSLVPKSRPLLLDATLIGAVVVMVFAFLQVAVLPKDALSVIGYGEDTIAPYLTVDENEEYVRINSTLRGPNSLGAYAVIVLSLVGAYLAARWQKLSVRVRSTLVGLAGLSVIALWASYSRSALGAAVIALGALGFLLLHSRARKVFAAGLIGLLLLVGVSVYTLRDTDFISHVVLHEDPNEGNDVNSNDGHVSSFIEGFELMLVQPLGAGIGSTGSASLLGGDGLIIENQYFFIAHEAGWPGLIFFLVIFGAILWSLYERRRDWLSMAVLVGGIGLAAIGLLLPVWVDDTVALVWWGLAGIALASPVYTTKERGVE